MGHLTHEEVVCVWVRAANAEKLHKVMKLAMNVATDCYRAFLQTRLDMGVFRAGTLEQLTTGCTFDSSCKTSRA